MKKKDKINALVCAWIQVAYMMRPHCHILCQKPKNIYDDPRWLKHLDFLDKLWENLHRGGVKDGSELDIAIIVKVLTGIKNSTDRRCELLTPVLEVIEYMIKDLNDGKLPWKTEPL